MGQRRDRLDKRLNRQKVTRQGNSIKKEASRNRIDSCNLELLKKGEFPYTPGLMSWLSVKLNKKASQIQPADVKAFLTASK